MGTQCNYVKEHCEKANAKEKKPWQCTTTTKKMTKKQSLNPNGWGVYFQPLKP
jgi:hypothetical protein